MPREINHEAESVRLAAIVALWQRAEIHSSETGEGFYGALIDNGYLDEIGEFICYSAYYKDRSK
jgi:hypothetical protein